MKNLPPDSQRCLYTTSDGKRCRSPRMEGDTTLCGPHYFNTARRSRKQTLDPALEYELLGPDQRLDSAQAVNDFITRIVRAVIAGRLATRHASVLAYTAQLAISSLPQLQKELASQPQTLLAPHPDVALETLAQTLQGFIASQPTQPATSHSESSSDEPASAEPSPTSPEDPPPIASEEPQALSPDRADECPVLSKGGEGHNEPNSQSGIGDQPDPVNHYRSAVIPSSDASGRGNCISPVAEKDAREVADADRPRTGRYRSAQARGRGQRCGVS
jgi:hypothetical protein